MPDFMIDAAYIAHRKKTRSGDYLYFKADKQADMDAMLDKLVSLGCRRYSQSFKAPGYIKIWPDGDIVFVMTKDGPGILCEKWQLGIEPKPLDEQFFNKLFTQIAAVHAEVKALRAEVAALKPEPIEVKKSDVFINRPGSKP